MIILSRGCGSHSNRLFQNINFEAYCKENNIEYINPSFFNLRKYYLSPCKILKGIKGIFCLTSFICKVARKLKIIAIIDYSDKNNFSILPPPRVFT